MVGFFATSGELTMKSGSVSSPLRSPKCSPCWPVFYLDPCLDRHVAGVDRLRKPLALRLMLQLVIVVALVV